MADDHHHKTTQNPATLYKQCLKSYVTNLNYNVVTLDKLCILRTLPPIVLADIYCKMCTTADLANILFEELSNLEIFCRLLKFSAVRQKLFRCFTFLIGNKKEIASELATKCILSTPSVQLTKTPRNSMNFNKKSSNIALATVNVADNCCDNGDTNKSQPSSIASTCKTPATTSAATITDAELYVHIDFGLRLGSFLTEAGWPYQSMKVLERIALLIYRLSDTYENQLLYLDCAQRLLHARSGFSAYRQASCDTENILININEIGIDRIPNNLLANIYTQISVFHYGTSEYNLSYSYSIKALQRIDHNTPDKITVDVLLQAAKSCVVKRQFKRASMLIIQAVRRARTSFGKYHQKYADALLDYGFFLLNIDAIGCSVNMYSESLDIKRRIFGERNLQVAIAHEDYAYALYVQEYSSGRFQRAREHVEQAINIMKEHVPCDHLMLSSAKRVKALILEEIALDNMPSPNNVDYEGLLRKSEELHQSALQLALEAFGEVNVQTAKHYGNLGRLYQSMMKFDEAEEMHQRAIKIKTDILGPYDYEVGLSIGHLASLYNYHMKKHRDAEALYLRSIAISLRLFGETYSGLEYDYRGLCHVYEALHETEKSLDYARLLDAWKVLRQENEDGGQGRIFFFSDIKEDTSMEEITKRFFEMCADTDNNVIAPAT